FKCCGNFLFLKLPSGRKLAYPFVRPKLLDPQHGAVVFADSSDGQFRECRNGDGAYAGLWTENVVSGIARDLLAEAMLRLEAHNYRVTLHVHDEIIVEMLLENFSGTEEFTRLMTQQRCCDSSEYCMKNWPSTALNCRFRRTGRRCEWWIKRLCGSSFIPTRLQKARPNKRGIFGVRNFFGRWIGLNRTS